MAQKEKIPPKESNVQVVEVLVGWLVCFAWLVRCFSGCGGTARLSLAPARRTVWMGRRAVGGVFLRGCSRQPWRRAG